MDWEVLARMLGKISVQEEPKYLVGTREVASSVRVCERVRCGEKSLF